MARPHDDETSAVRTAAQLTARGLTQWPLLLVLVVVGAGMVLAELHHWRRGSFVIGGAMLLAAFLRAVLPDRLAGLLVVRSKWLDLVAMISLGVAICVLALLVPGRDR